MNAHQLHDLDCLNIQGCGLNMQRHAKKQSDTYVACECVVQPLGINDPLPHPRSVLGPMHLPHTSDAIWRQVQWLPRTELVLTNSE